LIGVIRGIEIMNIDHINLNLLRVFQALMTERSVTKAAARLRLTQSATSSALSRLRMALDDTLFVRTPTGMQPTTKAIAIAEPIGRALEDFARALERSTHFDPSTASRTFHVATTDHALFVLLPSLTAAVQNQAPGVRLDVSGLGPQHNIDTGQLEQLDMMIAPFTNRGPTNFRPPPNARIKKLFTERIVVLARRQHPKIRTQLSLATFADAEHILIAPRGSWLTSSVDRAMAKEGITRNIRVTLPHYLIAPYVIASTDFLVTLPERLARHAVASLPIDIHPLPIAIPEFSISMAWHDRLQHDPAHQWLRGRLSALCRTV
jgi:DNA-binding transcriptional LysR family regulator